MNQVVLLLRAIPHTKPIVLIQYDNTKRAQSQPKKSFVIFFSEFVCFYPCRLYAFSIFIILLCNYFVINSAYFPHFRKFAFSLLAPSIEIDYNIGANP
jgi:hypothetical protein